jgi:hypothetical protein
MERFTTLMHQGKLIVRLDFSNLSIFTKTELNELIDRFKAFLATKPLGSILTLTNVTKMNFDKEILNAFIESMANSKPYVKAGAVVGIAGLQTIGLSAVTRNALREIHSFDTEAQALEWLVEQ